MSIDVEYCYERSGPMVLRRCRKMQGGEEAAADAIQDVFVKLMSPKRARIEALSPGEDVDQVSFLLEEE